ncbi:MAG: copper transporter [Halanaerobiaceae bacterium]
MVLNFRYHVFTITAIFAALGMGILIGSSIISENSLIAEQKKIIENIGRDINKLKEENNNLVKANSLLKEEIDYRLKVEKKLLPILLKDALNNRKYYLYFREQLEDSNLNDFRYLLNISGANLKYYQIDNQDNAGENKFQLTEENISRIIFWNLEEDRKGVDFIDQFNLDKERVITYSDSDVVGLLLKLLEAEMNG